MDKLQQLAGEFWGVLSEMAPYLLFGFFVAGFLSVFISPRLVEKNLGGHGIWPVIKASLFGIPLPLCSCGVIPVAASLRRHGASRGATTSFLLSTPQTGVDSIMVTYSLLGFVFAVFRPVAALVTGLIGGTITEYSHKGANGGADLPEKCDTGCCSPGEIQNKFFQALRYGFVTLPQDIGKALIVGLGIASVIQLAIPDEFFTGLLGGGIWPMLAMMAAGIPVYVCATASVPVAAALMAKGVSAGAVFVFLMTGPATNAAAITTIWKVLGMRTALIYLATVAVSAIGAGIALDYLFVVNRVQTDGVYHWMLPGVVNDLSAVILLAVLGYAMWKSRINKELPLEPETQMEATVLKIKGMTCNHCAENVKRAIEESTGVESATVDLRKGEAYINGKDYDIETISKAIEKIGYSII